MEDISRNRLKIMGKTPAEWEKMLSLALEKRDYLAMKGILEELGKEVIEEREAVYSKHDQPVLHRALELARRLVNTDPTELEYIEEELSKESCMWQAYQERYREAFIPKALEPYLRATVVMLHPDETGIQFKGFGKYSGECSGGVSESVTLFHKPASPPGGAPNFFTKYDSQTCSAVISRAYRMDLPPRSGAACIEEQIRRLCGDPLQIRRIYIENIKNSATYNACVCKSELNGECSARDRADPGSTPLGKLAFRLASALGLAISSAEIYIDCYGFLDIAFITSPIP